MFALQYKPISTHCCSGGDCEYKGGILLTLLSQLRPRIRPLFKLATLQVTLGITTLLSMTVFLMVIGESMPPTSEKLPLIGE
jgi:hypothetical protein